MCLSLSRQELIGIGYLSILLVYLKAAIRKASMKSMMRYPLLNDNATKTALATQHVQQMSADAGIDLVKR